MENDQTFMQLALDLAAGARGNTNPNPLVGAVLVKDGVLVGTGLHRKAGEPHAEVHALRMAGELARGATLYVTLEPCAHYGKTPPCADFVKASGVTRVFIAMQDPNPAVAGRGIQLLRDAGITVEVGLLEAQARLLNERFIHNMRAKRPFVVSKVAMTLDGKIATANGHSKWVTGEEARQQGHQLRHEMDAILVGIGTVLADNPRLTTRLTNRKGKNPIRIILDSSLQTPLSSHVANTKEAQTIIVTSHEASEEREQLLIAQGVEIIRVTENDQGLHLDEILANLYLRGITDVLVEGGSTVNSSFLRAALIDKFIVYIAPKIIGGAHSLSPFGGTDVLTMDAAVPLDFSAIQKIGDDLCLVAYPQRRDDYA